MPARRTTPPARPAEDPDREERIEMEIVVDAYGEDERASGWFCYLDDRLACPFVAECVGEMEVSPLKKKERVTVLKVLDLDDPGYGTFFAQVEWQGRKMGVPLAQLVAVNADEDTSEALADWRYWVARGYSF